MAYAESAIAPLEAALKTTYTLENTLRLLKLYQFHPSKLDLSLVADLLARALAVGDFHACSLMLNASIRADERVAKVFAVNEAFETANYKQFWALLRASGFEKLVPAFTKLSQEQVLTVVGLTYQRIEKSLLIELLGGESEAELAQMLAARPGWVIEKDLVRTPLQAKNNDVPQSKGSVGASTEQKLAILQALSKK